METVHAEKIKNFCPKDSSVRGGRPFLESLEDFQTEPPIHLSFLEMTTHQFYILLKWPPPDSDCCGN